METFVNPVSRLFMLAVLAAFATTGAAPTGESGLVGYWRFEEGAGSTVKDETKNNLAGTHFGAGWNKAGAVGGCLEFNGQSYVAVPHHPALNLTAAVTVEFWARYTVIAEGYVLDKGNDNYGFLTYAADKGRMTFFVKGLSGNPLKTNDSYADGQWHHFAGTYDRNGLGPNFKLYVDGALDQEAKAQEPILTDDKPLIFGKYVGGYYFTGALDDVQLYDRALNHEEIAAHFTLGPKPVKIPETLKATAIIKDGPFYTRDSYRKEYPQFCVQEPDFIFNRTLYVSPDQVAPRAITYSHDRPKRYLETGKFKINLVFDFPAEVDITGLRESDGLEPVNIVYPETAPVTLDGKPGKRFLLKPTVIVDAPDQTGVHMVYFKTTLPAGQVTKGYYYLTWDNGSQPPQEIRIESIHIPKVKPPKKFFTGVWGMQTADIKLLFPEFPKDFTSLGLNTISFYYVGHWPEGTERLKAFYELGDPVYQAARANNLFVMYNDFQPWAPNSEYGWQSWVKKELDARALDIEGKQVPNWGGYCPCPSYRGEYYQDALNRLKTFSQLQRWPASFFSMDLEIYGSEGRKICFCPRCLKLFEAWFKTNCPGLEYIDPVTLNREVKRPESGSKNTEVATQHPLHYKAWVEFKIEQFTDMWKGMRDVIAETVGEVRTAPFTDVVLADWAGVYPTTIQQEDCFYGHYTMKNGFQLYAVGAYGPAGLVFQPIFEGYVDLYYRQLKNRRSMYDTPPVAGYGWSGPGVATKPERAKYYLLETVMNGLQGMLIYPYQGWEGKQMAVNAEVLGSLRLVEDIVTEGERVTGLQVEGKEVHARGFRLGGEMVVLAGDNYVATDRRELRLTCPVMEKVAVYDILKHSKLGELTPANPTILLVLDKLDDRARFLYIGNRWPERLDR